MGTPLRYVISILVNDDVHMSGPRDLTVQAVCTSLTILTQHMKIQTKNYDCECATDLVENIE